MEPSFWHERWERAEIGFHKSEINAHLSEFWSTLQLAPGQRVFVPLCGKSLDLLWLAGEGHPVTGVEISAIAVAAFFAENNLPAQRYHHGAFEVWEQGAIRILCGDFFALTAASVADCAAVYDRAALIALPPPLRQRYVQHLDTLLPAGMRTLLITLEYEQSARPGPPFAVDEAEVRHLYGASHAIEVLHVRDALSAESRWRERGITWLYERVYRLTRGAAEPMSAA